MNIIPLHHPIFGVDGRICDPSVGETGSSNCVVSKLEERRSPRLCRRYIKSISNQFCMRNLEVIYGNMKECMAKNFTSPSKFFTLSKIYLAAKYPITTGNTLLKSDVTRRDHVFRCHGSHECWFTHRQFHSHFHSRRHSLRITLKYTTGCACAVVTPWITKTVTMELVTFGL